MPGIIITTPKSEMTNAAQEARDCIKNKGGYYFRRFSKWPCNIERGERVWYVEAGYLRGYAVVYQVGYLKDGQVCKTTGKTYPAGFYIFMKAESWRWVKPVPYKGFQGYRRAMSMGLNVPIGGWKDPKPEIKK